MVVGSLETTLKLHGNRSLKDKRRVIRSLIDRVRRRFGVSCAEVGLNDNWNAASIGVCAASGSAQEAEKVCQSVLRFLEQEPEFDLEFVFVETFRTQ